MQNQTRNILLATALTFTLAGAAEAQGTRPARFADGVYAATGEYGGQPSHITVRATLKDGIVTAVTVTPHAHVPRSLELQRSFAAAVPKLVVGKGQGRQAGGFQQHAQGLQRCHPTDPASGRTRIIDVKTEAR